MSGRERALARSLIASSSGGFGSIQRAGRGRFTDASVVTVASYRRRQWRSSALGGEQHAARFTHLDEAVSRHHLPALKRDRCVAVSTRSAAEGVQSLRALAANPVVLSEDRRRHPGRAALTVPPRF